MFTKFICSQKSEQFKKVNMKPLIVADILKNLKTNTNIEGEWVETEDNNGNITKS